ncbi:amidohydrolase-domain-containing protein [Gymnopilus junonius]|uniref:Amidohydrolase-domain-containing protein n=1 Tax=Gymnopilus junonius TaxID=109634 RepID=A0A9P5NCL7_GYMJU|nr:amidohydrolase-domain-containing protein [Gymnopilus junonius]
MKPETEEFPALFRAVFTQPAIDNHAHPLLKEATRDKLAFEGLISEAEGAALTEDAIHTVACMRATKQLAKLFGLNEGTSWGDVKKHRAAMNYLELCKLCFSDAVIDTILIDDGLGGVAEMAEEYKWHDQFTPGRTKRIVRVEIVAETILKDLFASNTDPFTTVPQIVHVFEERLQQSLAQSALESDVVGFKSIVCYRTGLDVSLQATGSSGKDIALKELFKMYSENQGRIRMAHKAVNDEVVRIALEVAGQHRIPVQFHTGLGDSDITLTRASPAQLQPIIKAYPGTKIVLLHSSYPFTREAGYLTAVYHNVYLDFGEVFPFLSGEGQRAVIRQVLELSPTNKIMWSSDGHWWPESYYLGVIQARQALYEVLSELVRKDEISEAQAIGILYEL